MKRARAARLFLCVVLLPLLGVVPMRAAEPEAGVKSAGVFYSPEKLRRYREAAGFEKARENMIAAAKPWLSMSYDELRDMIIPPAVGPRSLMVWSNGYCPVCRKQVSMYSWVYDHDSVWHFSCPHCGERFPKNDFKRYYNSGISPRTGSFDPVLADRQLLYNTEHPDPSDPLHTFGVDDGSGMKADGNTWYFVARAQYSNWQERVMPALSALSAAYRATGDPAYAGRVMVLLCRIADFFPDYDFMEQGYNYEIHQTPGYVTYCIDSAYEVRTMAESYDCVFDAAKNDGELLLYLSKQAGSAGMKTFADLQRHIERRIFLEALSHPDKIRTNFPNTDITVITVEMVLGYPKNRDDVMRRITEMTAEATLVDGTTGEKGLPSYTATALRNLSSFLAKISGVDAGFLPGLIRAVPSLHTSYRMYFDMRVGDYYPNVGDATYLGRKWPDFPPAALVPYAEPSVFSYFYELYRATGDTDFIRMMAEKNGGASEGLPYDPYRDDGEAVRAEVDRVLAEDGARYKPQSADYRNYRLAMLRGESGLPALWISYDNEARSHRHRDLLNMGLYYRNLDLMPDFGYPPVNMGAWDSEYVQWYQGTAGHNTVVSDHRYPLSESGSGVTELWLPGKRVQAVTIGTDPSARKKRMSGAVRTAVLVNTAPGEGYVLDVFRARRSGADSYTLSLSAGWGSLQTEGLTLTEAENPFPENVTRAAKNDPAAQPGWSAEFIRTDHYGYNNPAQDVRLKYTGLSEGSSVWTAEAWTQDNFNDGNVFWIPRLCVDLAPQKGNAATFVGLLEPFTEKSGIASVRRLPVLDGNKKPLGESYVAVEVLHTDGSSELVVVNGDGTATEPGAQPNTKADRVVGVDEWKVETDARILVVRKDKSKTATVTASTCSVLQLSGSSIGSAAEKAAAHMELENLKPGGNNMPQIITAAVAGAIFLSIVIRYVVKNWQKRSPEEDEREEERRRGRRD